MMMKKLLLLLSLFLTFSNADTTQPCMTCSAGSYLAEGSVTVSNLASYLYQGVPDNFYYCSATQQEANIYAYTGESATYVYYSKTFIVSSCQTIPDCAASGKEWDSELQECVVPACDNPLLVPDENGTCACPGLGEEYDSNYDICILQNPSCPVQTPPSCIHDITNNTYLRTWYDCIGIYKQQTGEGSCTWPGEPDNDTDGIPDHLDPDDDNDGYSDEEEAARGTDPNDPNSNTGSEEGCDDNDLGLNEKFSTNCERICLDDYERDNFGVCQEFVIEAENDCNRLSVYKGYPFKTFADTYSSCLSLINQNGGSKGAYYFLVNCDQGNTACYYKEESDEENQALDTNTTDLNGSTIIDDTNIVNGLTNINDNINRTNTALDAINSNINNQTDTLGGKLDSLHSVTSQTGDNINSSVNNMNSSLGTKLDTITTAINNKPTGVTDMTETNTLLQDLNDKLADREEGRAELDLEINNGSSILTDALFSFAQTKNDLIAIANGANPPSVSSSGSCTLGANVSFGSFNLDFTFLSDLRPYFQFFLNLFLLYITIKLYALIARDAAKLIGLI